MWELIRDAGLCLVVGEDKTIRVIGAPLYQAGSLIEITLSTAPLRQEMFAYGLRVLWLSAFISFITAGLLFMVTRLILVRPIRAVVDHMRDYAKNPSDWQKAIRPSATIIELREAEEGLAQLETQVAQSLKERQRLAQLGEAVAKISHDLRNILTSVQLFADRIEMIDDPQAKRVAPKLVAGVSRAINLTEGALAYGKAQEPPPRLSLVPLATLVDEVIESEPLAMSGKVTFLNEVAGDFSLRADSEQLYRILQNLTRNAILAIEQTGKEGSIRFQAHENEDAWTIEISDTGPGLPPKAREYLFQPFQGGARRGGIGLGLAICQELASGHGGRLVLKASDETGTTFELSLPKANAIL
jgi:signal transduction histidine kinase